MKLILSRKGFDTSAGGVPSPILPDGSLISLPIPDGGSQIRYRDLQCQVIKQNLKQNLNIGTLVKQLSRNRITGVQGAHLDPDLIYDSYPRSPGWQPVLGQTGSAQGHLRKQGVGEGDLFLFFGLFREAEKQGQKWRFVPGSTAKHLLWGWLQIGEILAVDSLQKDIPPWLSYHPHMHGLPDANNTLYIGRDQLSINSALTAIPGSGVFSHYSDQLCLTDPGSRLPSQWRLPGWFYPEDRAPLSYHAKMERWGRDREDTLLRCAARGQEFVLDAGEYPESISWIRDLVESA
ncbi:hypothetical protein [Amphritea sp. HPY]|uniref:Nmad3 family putative nucleotide modification protein n=1 Tax=Amphritea sp. HPY TaxID=3421652 RepID=UPI003D7D4873